MEELKNYSDLQSYFDNAAFVLKTQQQIAKDFAKFNLFFPEKFEETPLQKWKLSNKSLIYLRK